VIAAALSALAAAPELARAIAPYLHEVCSHGYRWVHQFSYKEDREREFIRKATESLRATTGERPYGWLSRYLTTDNTRRLLVEEGDVYHMDDLSDDVPRWDVVEAAGGAKPIVIVPYAIDTNDMKFWTAPSLTPDSWLDYAIATFDHLYEEGAHRRRIMVVSLHDRISGHANRVRVLDRFLAYARSKPGVWFARKDEIAAWALEHRSITPVYDRGAPTVTGLPGSAA